MSYLQNLHDARTLKDLANMLGFKPSSVAYILYKMPDAWKYTTFEIPKRGGGIREIKAPARQLKLLQRRLANLLYRCLDEIGTTGTSRRSLAHGFERDRSIVTNASLHKRRRYVLNLDLEDFFPSFNFGRVRGFFIKDRHFAVDEKVATLVAQIACHDNQLPQGSPCSPIISNLIGHLLDVRLARFAKLHKCTYSRYADDITFSTNQKEFPPALAAPVPECLSRWELGQELVVRIETAGFRINGKKTRMQIRGSRQVATGLLVNEKVNVRPEYYRTARAMCQTLFSTGAYYRLVPANVVDGEAPEGAPAKTAIAGEVAQLESILAHTHYVKRWATQRQDDNNNNDKKKEPSEQILYRRFLYYKNFVALQAPLIIPEGKTDSIYLLTAIKNLIAYQPILGQLVDGEFYTTIRFMRYTPTVHEVMKLGNGTGAIARLIYNYRSIVQKFRHAPLEHPVILLIDNDDGAKPVLNAVKNFGVTITYVSNSEFYHLWANLYLVKTPEGIGAHLKSCIEDLFDANLLKTVIDGKKFDPDKDNGGEGTYGKLVFAEKVVRANADTIDFSKFALLLDRIVAVLGNYKERREKIV